MPKKTDDTLEPSAPQPPRRPYKEKAKARWQKLRTDWNTGVTLETKRKWSRGIGAGVLAIFCCFVMVRVSRPILLQWAHYILRSEHNSEREYGNRVVTVEVEKMVKHVMPKYINTIGELKANASVVLHAEVNGLIKEISFVEGAFVSKGDLLIRLADESFQAELRSYEAQLVAAETELGRLEKMRKANIVSQKEYDKTLAERNVAKSRVEQALAQLQKTEIRAPFDGVIGLIDVGAGSFVQTNQELVTLVDQTPIKVKFSVPGKFVNDVGIGQVVELKVDACKNRVFQGTVEAVDSHVDSATNSVWMRASIPNEEGVLKAGLFANVTLVIGEQSDTISVDESAIERIGEQEFVWVVERGKARRTGVLTGVRDKGRIEIVAGLKEGQLVVVAGQLRLSEGTWVKPTNLPEEEKPAAGAKEPEKTAAPAA